MRRQGATACPDGWTSTQIEAYEDATDTRACSGCGCDTSTIGCTGGMAAARENSDCSGTLIALDPTCKDVSALTLDFLFLLAIESQAATAGQGTCTQSLPSGALDPVGDTRICCKPAP